MRNSFRILTVALLLSACNLPPTQPGPGPSPTPGPSSSPTASPDPNPSPSPVAPAGGVKLIQWARCEQGSLWAIPKDEEIAVAPCPPPETQPPYIQPAATQQIPESAYEGLKERFGAFALRPAPELLGSLDPALPMADALKSQCNAGDGVVMHGGLLGSCSQYVVAEDDKDYRLLETSAEFQTYFAPISSPAEAASYAIARSGDKWKSSLHDLKDSFVYYNRLIRRSRVEEVEGGYEVLLYHFRQFGCGPHPTSAVTWRVGRDGSLSKLSEQLAWRDPMMDGLCID